MKLKKSDLKKLDKESLINLLLEVSKLNKENDAFLKSKLNSDFDELFVLSCKKIEKAFSCYELMSLKDARQALIDFKKSGAPDLLFIELCLYYIKEAYDLEQTDWRFQDNFYSAIEKVYGLIFETLKKDAALKDKYGSKIENLIKKSNEGFGHKDYLKEEFEGIK